MPYRRRRRTRIVRVVRRVGRSRGRRRGSAGRRRAGPRRIGYRM